MGFYKTREQFAEELASAHPLIKHNQPVDIYNPGGPLRKSFFRINDEEELTAAAVNWMHLPCLVQFGLSCRPINKGGSIRQQNINTWIILTKATPNYATGAGADAISDAYDITFDIVQDLKKSVLDEYDNNGGCGVFHDVEEEWFKWEQYGPVNDQLYGWIMVFTDETKPS